MTQDVDRVLASLIEGEEDSDLVKDVAYQSAEDWMTVSGFESEHPGKWMKYLPLVAVNVSRIGPGKYGISFYRKNGSQYEFSHIYKAADNDELIRSLSDIITNNQVIKENEEDDDSELVKEVQTEILANWLRNNGFRRDNIRSGWYKRMGSKAVTVSNNAANSYTASYYNRTAQGWALDHHYVGDAQAVISQLADVADLPFLEGLEDEGEDDDLLKDVSPTDIKLEILEHIESGLLYVSGNVTRSNNHYVHERTTSCELREEWNSQVDHELEERIGTALDALTKEIDQKMIAWNRKIYRELEAAYDDSVSEEVVANDIRANNYTFDEEGSREDEGLPYDALSPGAKERAREWWVQGMLEMGQTYYAEPVIAEWRWLLKNKGFDEVTIDWSGFWNQGDGASFTAKSIDLQRYLKGPDPLEFPESEREQLDESEEEDIEPKDVYHTNRRALKNIENRADYAEYEERVREFFAREGIDSLTSVGNEDNPAQTDFSSRPCEVCRRPLAGTRLLASGYNPTIECVQVYEICTDCEYYAAYGRLDDQTMLLVSKNPNGVEEAREGAEQERGIWYHGTSSKLIPKILAQGLVTDPKLRSWSEDPNASIVQASRKSLKNSIYVTTNLLTATGSALRVAQRDKTNQAVVVMSLQPRSMVADEDSVGHWLTSIESHLSGSAYHHIWPYLMEVYGDRYQQDEDRYLTNAAIKMKTDWVQKTAKSLFFKFGEKNVRPELEKRVLELLHNEGYRAMLERNVSYIEGLWDLNHWKTEWSRGFGTWDDAPPIPDKHQAEDNLLAFNDKLSRAMKNMARPLKMQNWSLSQSGRVLKPVGFTGKDRIICIFEIERAEGPDYHSRMIVHYGKPPQKAIDDWRQAINGLDRDGDIVYKNYAPKKPLKENEEEDFEVKELLGEPPPPPPTFEVRSSHGLLEVTIDGKVVKCELYDPQDAEGQSLTDIDKFNVEEFEIYWNDKIEAGQSIDILDLGYWTKDGQYESPDLDWRFDQ